VVCVLVYISFPLSSLFHCHCRPYIFSSLQFSCYKSFCTSALLSHLVGFRSSLFLPLFAYSILGHLELSEVFALPPICVLRRLADHAATNHLPWFPSSPRQTQPYPIAHNEFTSLSSLRFSPFPIVTSSSPKLHRPPASPRPRCEVSPPSPRPSLYCNLWLPR